MALYLKPSPTDPLSYNLRYIPSPPLPLTTRNYSAGGLGFEPR